jgi:hypothetical protein
VLDSSVNILALLLTKISHACVRRRKEPELLEALLTHELLKALLTLLLTKIRHVCVRSRNKPANLLLVYEALSCQCMRP